MGDGMTREEIEAAARRIEAHVRVTPCVALDGLVLKLEGLQHSGSFKARGAFNSLLSQPVPEAGVIAASGGNHGAAVAYAAQALGKAAEIFVPEIASPAKLQRIRDCGARVIVTGATYAEAFAACEARQRESGALLVHAYDQAATLAGQGTVAREFLAQAPGLDSLLVAVGGGGLIGGMAAWCAAVGGPKVVAVEPESCATLHAALEAGRPVDVPVSGLAADSLGARRVGRLMFPIAQTAVARSVLVEDGAIKEAQRHLWRELRVVAEPGGAAALAALLSGRYAPAKGERVGVLICGANCDPASVV
jgi:threonine dehydratase